MQIQGAPEGTIGISHDGSRKLGHPGITAPRQLIFTL
jgi:hypothetical protein